MIRRKNMKSIKAFLSGLLLAGLSGKRLVTDSMAPYTGQHYLERGAQL